MAEERKTGLPGSPGSPDTDYLPLELPPLLFILLIPGLEVALELALEGLHVDLEPQLGVFGRLQLVLQLFQLGLHLLHLRLQGPLGLLQLMDLSREGCLHEDGQAAHNNRPLSH